jgi:hypothetical protein
MKDGEGKADEPPKSHVGGMAIVTHVDVVRNEWLAGYQFVVARLREDHGQVQIDAEEPWAGMLQRTREQGWADNDHSFVVGLHEHLTGDYVFATPPHDERDCPFRAMVVPMSARPVEGVRAPVLQ